MANQILLQRLFKFAQDDSALSSLFDDCKHLADFIDQLEDDPEFLDTLVMAYKSESKQWRAFNGQPRIALHPCVDLQEVERVSRKADEKMVVLCGWLSDEGGLEGHCAYCGIPISIHEVTVDHVDPQIQGGAESLNNLVPACIDCNQEKGGQQVEQFLTKSGLSQQDIAELCDDWKSAFEYRGLAAQNWTFRLSDEQARRLAVK